MTPFIQSQTLTQAGIFIAIGHQSSSGNIAEKICAAMANKIPDNEKPLDQNWWAQCVSNIPGQVDTMIADNKYSTHVSLDDVSKEIAGICLSSAQKNPVSKTSTDDAIAYISSLKGLTAFNCLSISALDNGKLTISLTFFTIANAKNASGKGDGYEITIDNSTTAIDMTSKNNVENIAHIFDGFSPISGEDYFVSIPQKQPILQSKLKQASQ